jgi:hypothetical protein
VEKRKDPPASPTPTFTSKPTATPPAASTTNNLTSVKNLASDNNLDLMWTNESFYPASNKPTTLNQLASVEEKK